MNSRDRNTLLRLREKVNTLDYVALSPAQFGALQRAAREAESLMTPEERAAFVRLGFLPAKVPK